MYLTSSIDVVFPVTGHVVFPVTGHVAPKPNCTNLNQSPEENAMHCIVNAPVY